jgi:histidyl-tRNA synthetase
MYQIKSGDEIVEQLFSLRDRGKRDLALRPEITPTLARMVNQRINALPKPIKWFSVPRLFRAERPQKGRLREFFQWNIDIIGEDSPLADAEIIFTTVDYLREIGLTSKDIKVKVSSRELLATYLISLGIPKDKLEPIYVILDKKNKLPPDTFEEILAEQIPDKSTVRKILDFMSVDSIPQLKEFVEDGSAAYLNIKCVLDNLDMMGVGDFCLYDPSIVRGLAYYTGIVFEVHDVAGELRAICGGGRYDSLLRDFGGPPVSATGMGMGDCVLEILLKEKALLQEQLPPRKLDYFVACADESYRDGTYKLAMKLRSAGWKAAFSYKASKLSKQLKEASDQNARRCVIIGSEIESDKLIVKNMATGEQKLVDFDKFLSGLKS